MGPILFATRSSLWKCHGIFRSHAAGDPVGRDPSVVCAVALLIFRRQPSAIFRTVIAARVDTVYLKLAGTLAHVGEKIRVVVPPLANRNALAAVLVEAWVVRIGAACLHAGPNPICRTLDATVAIAQIATVFESVVHRRPGHGYFFSWRFDFFSISSFFFFSDIFPFFSSFFIISLRAMIDSR
jgi:hypothetical protein